MVRQRRPTADEARSPPITEDKSYGGSRPPGTVGLRKGKRAPPPRTDGGGAPANWFVTAIMWAGIACVFSMTGIVKVRIGDLSEWWQIFDSVRGVPRVIQPHSAKKVTALAQFDGAHRERLYWGTYRPHLYLGVRARMPKSLLGGLMWMKMKGGRYNLRHTCEDGDGLERYGWLRHDGDGFGRQELIDGDMSLTTYFIKSHGDGAGYGGDWAVRIVARENEPPRPEGGEETDVKSKKASMLFYFVDESGKPFDILPASGDKADAEVNGPLAAGKWGEVGNWQMHVKAKKGAKANHMGLKTMHVHNLTEAVWGAIVENAAEVQKLELPNSIAEGSNLIVYQITADLPIKLDIVFLSGVGSDDTATAERVDKLSGSSLSAKIVDRENAFDKRFESTFKLQAKGLKESQVEVAKIALSNMLGGMGYFYGESKIALPQSSKSTGGSANDHLLYWPSALYTAVPSRPMFPRGFLWDEGFHQLLVGRWDQAISMDAMAHWLDLMNADGWIPREQILGEEARRKVPADFVRQHTSNANPPTLFLPILELARSLSSASQSDQEREAVRLFLQRSLPRLKSWFNWFNTSQLGALPGSYYWHGRDANTERQLNPQTLMSGLDDYPRASHPSAEERHVDLRCWMALGAESMAKIAQIVGEPDQRFEETAKFLQDIDLLNKLHLDAESGRYYDYGNHSEKVYLQRREHVDPRTGYVDRSLERVTLKKPSVGFVPQFGYVSLFPLLMKLFPANSKNLGQQLQLLRDEKLLWSNFGLRSLATTSSIYDKHNTEHDAPYWRGPVWININYLALASLRHYASVDGPFKEDASKIYVELRANLIRNIVRRYEESGFLWENYSHVLHGKGQGAHPFTGWTALIVLIMAEIF